MKSDSMIRINLGIVKHVALFSALLFIISFITQGILFAREISPISDEQISRFLNLSSSQQRSVLNRISPSQRQLIESFLGINRTESKEKTSSLKPSVAVPTDKTTSTATTVRDGKVPETSQNGLEGEPLVERKPRNLFERYRPIKEYQNVSTDLKLFGHDFFQVVTADVQMLVPRMDMPISSEYIIGPGDEVSLSIWGRINAEYYLAVDRDGNISIPNIGVTNVAGMRFDDMKNYLSEEVEKIFGAEASISLGGTKTINIFVLGEVKKPGMYPLDSLSTITNALMAAGGPTDIGSLRGIQLKRKNATIAVMDAYDLLLKGDKSQDKGLISGDVIFVPTVGSLVGVAGNVKRPAIYEIEDNINLKSVFELAGGIIPAAYTQQIRVERIQKNEREIVIDIDDRNLGDSERFMLQDGDLVKVFSIVEKIENIVTLSGNVKRPGTYEHKTGMEIKDVIKDKTDLLKETSLEYAIIKRKLPPDFETQVISFNLENAMTKDSLRLYPRDEIHIFSKWSFKDRPSVIVRGEVRKLSSHNELKSLVLQYRDLQEKEGRRGSRGEEIPLEMQLERENIEREVENRYPFSTDILQLRLQEIKTTAKEMKSREGTVPLEIENEIEELKGEIKNRGLYSVLLTAKAKLERLLSQEKEMVSNGRSVPLKIEIEIEELKQEIENRSMESYVISSLKLQDIRTRIADMEMKEDDTPSNLKYQVSGDQLSALSDHIQVPIFENYRVKDAILYSGGLTDDAYLEKCELIRIDEKGLTSQIYFNGEKALGGDPRENILLMDKDTIIIHSKYETLHRKTISIRGEVTNPGTYPLSKDMKVSDLVYAAGNLLESAYINDAELSFYLYGVEEGADILRQTIDLNKALSHDPEHDLTLSPNSTLLVKKIPDWGLKQYATISGEVLYPGRYNIRKGERLSSLIERAGGFTSEAYLRGAIFTRERVRRLQQERLDQLIANIERRLLEKSLVTTRSLIETEAPDTIGIERQREFIGGLKELRAKGRVTIALLPLDVLKGSSYDIVLETDDILYISTNPNSIQVVGAVFNQTAFLYDKTNSYLDYIDQAAGFTDMADEKNIYIFKVDGAAVKTKKGRTWNYRTERWELKSDIPALEPGDSIIIPTKIEDISWLRAAKDIMTVLYQMAITVGVVDNVLDIF